MSCSPTDSPRKHRIMLVDDHPVFREGLRLTLIKNPLVDEAIVQASSVAEAVTLLRELSSPDLLLLDIAMPGLSGLSGLDLLKQACPTVKIALLSAIDDPSVIKKAHDLQVAGFISKSLEASSLHQAVNCLLAGQPFFPSFLLHHSETEDSPQIGQHMTPRQLEVLSLMAQGHTNKVIARHLNLSENTVRVHVAAILKYLGVTTRMEAVFAARMQCIVS